MTSDLGIAPPKRPDRKKDKLRKKSFKQQEKKPISTSSNKSNNEPSRLGYAHAGMGRLEWWDELPRSQRLKSVH